MKALRKSVVVLTVLTLCFSILPTALADYSYYTVRRGDTLLKIANRHNSSVNDLIALNAIEDPDRIRAGQVLLVPTVYQTSGLTYDGLYTIRRGDTLRKIASRYNTTVESIADLNGIADPDQIRVGDRLWINPGSGDIGRVVDNYYYVQRGDTLSGIARRYGLNKDDLVAINGISNPNRIVVGQQLRLY